MTCFCMYNIASTKIFQNIKERTLFEKFLSLSLSLSSLYTVYPFSPPHNRHLQKVGRIKQFVTVDSLNRLNGFFFIL